MKHYLAVYELPGCWFKYYWYKWWTHSRHC